MSNPNNPRAYPSELTLKRQGAHVADWEINRGMSLRDYFAAKAMQGLMSIYWEVEDEFSTADELIKCHAETAYEYADAMLKERVK